MNRDELQAAIEDTLEKIDQVKEQIAHATDPKEKKRLRRELRELQYLQLWHIGGCIPNFV